MDELQTKYFNLVFGEGKSVEWIANNPSDVGDIPGRVALAQKLNGGRGEWVAHEAVEVLTELFRGKRAA